MTPLPDSLSEIFIDNNNLTTNKITAVSVEIYNEKHILELKEKFGMFAIGLNLSLPQKDEQEESFVPMEKLISQYKKRIKSLDIADEIEFITIMQPFDFAKTRAAVIAINDALGINAIVKLHVFEENRMKDSTDLLAAISTLEHMGIGTFILESDDIHVLSDATEYIAPYVKSTICVKTTKEQILVKGAKLYNTEMFCVPDFNDIKNFEHKLSRFKGFHNVPFDEDEESLPCSDGKDIHFVYPDTDISDEIECTSRFAEDVLEAEDLQAGALKISITEEEELHIFDEFQYMITRPVCLVAYDDELLERAIRVFNGRVIYDATWEVSQSFLKYLEHKYGIIIL